MKQRIVLFLGNADTEAVTAKLKASGKVYKRKMLESGAENWKSIISIFDEYDVSCVVAKLTGWTFNLIVREEYDSVRDELFSCISSRPNLIMAHESILTGIADNRLKDYVLGLNSNDPDINKLRSMLEGHYDDSFAMPEEEIVSSVIKCFSDYGMLIVPYNKNVELALVASSFIEENESSLIFRIYVPSGRMWGGEAEKLLQLFRDYLQKVSGLDVRQDQFRTSKGVVHEFFGGDGAEEINLPKEFEEFSSFMEMCVSNPGRAQAALASSNLNNSEVFDLVDRYHREARRLHVDIKHERERKLLSIRHRLEGELSEYVQSDEDWTHIDNIVEQCVPVSAGIMSVISANSSRASSAGGVFTVNVSPQIIETVNGVVAQEISGGSFSDGGAKELLEAINAYAESNKSALTSALYELNDKSLRTEDRVSAKHLLKGFVFSIAGRLGDVAAGVLQSYIEKQSGL